jgi:hypothetical protein
MIRCSLVVRTHRGYVRNIRGSVECNGGGEVKGQGLCK